MKALGWSAALLTAGLIGMFLALTGLVTIAIGAASTGAPTTNLVSPSQEALNDIPAILLPLFIGEAEQCPGLPWTVLAGISRVESGHARHGGATIGRNGVVTPSIIGIALNGEGGTARIADTDNGEWDNDPVWDHAVGPFQFIPSSWRIFGGDGNADGIADPNNIYDALPAMRRHICPQGRVTNIDAAIYAYNHSTEYVAAVLDWAGRYGRTVPSAAPVAGRVLPVAAERLDENLLTRPHHDYPASDLPVPVGTPVFAMVDGTVVTAEAAGIYPIDPNRCGNTIALDGVDGAHYVYCHLSRLTVAAGQSVTAGTIIGLSGGLPGAPGAGNTSGPHLHLGIGVNGSSACPQPLLLAIYRQQPFAVAAAPGSGCITGLPVTDWSRWLAALPAIAPNS